jgi:putative ABC transport system permease protein
MRIVRLLRRALRRRARGDEIAEEMRAHVELEAESLVAEGVAPVEARRRAQVTFGGIDRFREEARDADRTRWVEAMLRDFRFALRTLRRTPAFTAVALFTLALGIGATTSVFTVVNGVLLRPLPYGDAERLVLVWETEATAELAKLPFSAANYLDLRQRAASLEAAAAVRSRTYALGGADGAVRVEGAGVAAALFDVLRARPLLGRVFEEADDRAGAARVVLLSHALWQSRFGGSADIIGQNIVLNGASYGVIGVMPAGFTFPRGAELPAPFAFPERTALWTPLAWTAEEAANRGTQNLVIVARLREGTSLEAAQADLRAVARSMSDVSPQFAQGGGFRAVSLQHDAVEPVRARLLLLLGVAAFVMLIACANVANLLLVRGLARARELSLRAALGAGRARVALQLVTESLVLTGLAAVAAVLVSVLGTRFMLRLVPGQLPRADDVAVDANVLVVTLGTAALIGLLFGVVSLLHIDRSRIAATLTGGRGTSVQHGPMRRLLSAAEVAVAVVLLVGAMLLATSFVKVQRIAPGFDHDDVVVAGLLVPFGPGFDPTRDGPRWIATFSSVIDRLSAQAGVEVVGGVSALPLTGIVEYTSFGIEGVTAAPDAPAPTAEYAIATPGYFTALRIPLVRGRNFSDRDRADTPLVALINEAFAARFFPGENPLGRRLRLGFSQRDGREIVGVLANVRRGGLDAEVQPAVFMPLHQVPYPFQTIAVRTQLGPGATQQLFRAALRAVDPTLAWGEIRPLADVVSESLAHRRFSALLVGIFAGAALVLTLVGLYGTIAFATRQRTRELGVRLALGATRGDVLRLVLRDGMRPTALGVVTGLAGATFLTRLLRAQLYQVTTTDVRVYGAAALGLAIVALAASLLPAWRAARLEPVRALRED